MDLDLALFSHLGVFTVENLLVPFDYCCVSGVLQLQQAQTLFTFLQLVVELAFFLQKIIFITMFIDLKKCVDVILVLFRFCSTFPIQSSRRSTSAILWSLSAILASASLMFLSASSSRLMYSSSWACVDRNRFWFRWLLAFKYSSSNQGCSYLLDFTELK